MRPTRKNIKLYLGAKASLIEYFHGEGKPITDIYKREIEKPTIAGVILPEWVLALQTIVDILVGGLTIYQILRKSSEGKVSPQEVKIHGDKIIHIDKVENLRIVVSESRKKSKKKRARKKGSLGSKKPRN